MQKSTFLIPSFLVLLFMVSIFTSCQKEEVVETEKAANTYPQLDDHIKQYKIVEIDNKLLWNASENQTGTSVKLSMQEATKDPEIAKLSFTLERKQVQTEDFKFYLVGEGGKLTEANVPTPHVLDGQINDEKGGAFMIVNNENFRAEFSMDGDIQRLEPLIDHIKDAPANEYIYYNVADVIVNDKLTCGTDDAILDIQETSDEKQATGRSANNCLKVEISFMGDYELYDWKYGRNYNNAFNWMYWKMVSAGRMYHSYNGYPINFVFKFGCLNTWNGYIAHSWDQDGFLQEWRNFTTYNDWYQKGDANILFTGRNIGGNRILGAAWVQTICKNSFGYNRGTGPFTFVKHRWNPHQEDATTAHEIGHILGASHSDGGLMNGSYNGQTWLHPSTWNQLNYWVYRNNSCLSQWGCEW